MEGFLKSNDKLLRRHRRSVFLDNKINLSFNPSSNNPNGLVKQGNVVDKKVLSQVSLAVLRKIETKSRKFFKRRYNQWTSVVTLRSGYPSFIDKSLLLTNH